MKIRFFKVLFYILFFLVYALLTVAFFLLLSLIPYFKQESTSNLMFIVRALIASIVSSVILIPITQIKKIKSAFYNKLYTLARKSKKHLSKNLIESIVRLFYLNELECNNDIKSIYDHKINIISGEVFSGKSYLLEKYICDTICSKNASFEKIYLFDMGQKNCTSFIMDLECSNFKNAILILDNIDLLTSDEFNNLLMCLKRESNKFAKVIIVTSYDKIISNRFEDENQLNILTANVFVNLPDITERFRYAIMRKNLRRGKSTTTLLNQICTMTDNLSSLLVCNSVFKTKIKPSCFKISNLKYSIYCKRLDRYSILEKRFLNQNVAIQILINNVQKSGITREFFNNYSHHMANLMTSGKILNTELNLWIDNLLLYVINNKPVSRSIFDDVLLKYNLNYLLKIVKMINGVKSFDDEMNIQKAILLERCNELGAAAKLYKEIINSCVDSQNIFLQNYAKIGYICCCHTNINVSNLLNSITEDNHFIRYSKWYWKLHIEMHRGKFNYNDFKQLIMNLDDDVKDLAKNYSKYDVYHLLRRVYFETIRAYLLSNRNDCEELRFILDLSRQIPQFLISINPNEFYAFYTKFCLGRVLQFDYLSTKQFNASYSNYDILDIIKDISTKIPVLNLANNITNPIELNRKIYDKSIHLFNLIGGPQDKYVRFNLYELDLMQDTNFETVISEYDKYKVSCNKEGLNEYEHYALSYLIKAYMCWQLTPNEIEMDYTDTIKTLLNEYDKCLLNSKNSTAINVYAQCRFEMFTILYRIMTLNKIESVEKENEQAKISCRCHALAKKYKDYLREKNILLYIAERNGNININSLKNIIKFYPIVNQ